MERYHFFASSSRQFGSEHRFLSELKSDENKMGGTLSSVLSVLQRIHSMFFKLVCSSYLTIDFDYLFVVSLHHQ